MSVFSQWPIYVEASHYQRWNNKTHNDVSTTKEIVPMRIFRKLVFIPPLIVFLAVTLCLINIPHIAKASEFEGYPYSPEELTKLEEAKRIDEIQHAQVLGKVKEFDVQQMKKPVASTNAIEQ